MTRTLSIHPDVTPVDCNMVRTLYMMVRQFFLTAQKSQSRFIDHATLLHPNRKLQGAEQARATKDKRQAKEGCPSRGSTVQPQH